MEIGLVRSVDIDREMQQSYLDYAMSVIVSRALPDARDGLKPVQRRILYAMYDMGLRPDSPYKKSARIVGEVLGKYHPHGDLAVYEAMARMAQDFSMRETLVDGQGNFGSVDGDPPAAMRYTEARLTALATQMLNQLDRDTVDFHSNFDETLQEPEVLPAAVPNLLVNGGSGIAVGMATSIPPHNMQEVVDALVYMLRRWEELDEVSVSDLMQYIKGPDFPTGGIILLESDKDDLLTAYATGRGRIIVRGRVHVEEMGRGRSRIIITELPYQTNKSALMERIAELAREGHLEGIADLRDESDRQGMRIVIDLNKAAEQDNVLRELYRRTSLQSTFRISLLALVDNEPRLLSLKQALRVYLEHRMTVVRRRSEFDLNKARQRAHILAGLRIAIQNLDEIIQLIRRSQDADQARQRLMRQYKLDEAQAQAILDMPLRRLAALERKKIEDEYKELLKTIRELEDLLASPKKMRQVIETELLEVRAQFGDQRRTQIVKLEPGQSSSDLLTVSALTPGQEVWVGVTSEGCLGRVNAGQAPSLDGGMGLRWVFKANSHHTLVLVNVQGKAASIPAHALPEVTRFDDGAPYHKVSPLPEGEELAAVFALPNGDQPGERYLVTASRNGLVKKSAVSELPGPSGQAFTAVKVNEGDEIATAVISDGSETLFLATAKGMAIRFSEQEVRPMGLVAAGVNGIKLAAGDFVVSMLALDGSRDVYLFSSDGKVWRTPANQFPVQGRYGQGVIAVKLGKGASLAGAIAAKPSDLALLRLVSGQGRTVALKGIKAVKRGATGGALPGGKLDEEVLDLSPVEWEGAAASLNGRAEDAPKTASRAKKKAESAEPEVKKSTRAGRAAATTKTASKGKTSAAATKKPAAVKTAKAADGRASTTRAKNKAAGTASEVKPEKKAAKAAAKPKAEPKPRAAAKTTKSTKSAAPAQAELPLLALEAEKKTRTTAKKTAAEPKQAAAKSTSRKKAEAPAAPPEQPEKKSTRKRTASASKEASPPAEAPASVKKTRRSTK